MISLLGHVGCASPTDHISYELPKMTFDSAASFCIYKIKLTIHYTYSPITSILVDIRCIVILCSSKHIIHP